MDKKNYISKLARRIRIAFWILLIVTAYEALYWFSTGGRLSLVLVVLAGAVTYFAYTLMKMFDDMKNSIKD